jgi:hypothetical protein
MHVSLTSPYKQTCDGLIILAMPLRSVDNYVKAIRALEAYARNQQRTGWSASRQASGFGRDRLTLAASTHCS